MLGIDPPASELPPAILNAPVLAGGNVTISWEGAGTLQTSDVVSGPWVDAESQANPQTLNATGARFFRVVQ